MSTDAVVAKLDAWLKSHNQGAHDDYLEDALSDVIGIREELERMSEDQDYVHLEHSYSCRVEGEDCGPDCHVSASFLEMVSWLNNVAEQLNLVLNVRERAS